MSTYRCGGHDLSHPCRHCGARAGEACWDDPHPAGFYGRGAAAPPEGHDRDLLLRFCRHFDLGDLRQTAPEMVDEFLGVGKPPAEPRPPERPRSYDSCRAERERLADVVRDKGRR